MPSGEQFEAAYAAFEDYVQALSKFVDAMCAVGVSTRNVEPFANFAEVIVARYYDGVIQRAANKGYDVLAVDGTRVQVKSLRVSSARPKDNGRSWCECTRTANRPDDPLLDADRTALVVYVDFRPRALLIFPVALRGTFPVLGVRVLDIGHVERLLGAPAAGLASEGVTAIDLRKTPRPSLAESPRALLDGP